MLILQYNKGPALDEAYSRWSIYAGIDVNRINTDQKKTTPKLILGGFIQMEFRMSRTLGFVSGINYSPVKYSYQVKNSLVQDRISYFSIPLGIRLHPTKKTSIGLGSNFNVFNKAEFIRIEEDIENYEAYSKGVFKNSFGGFIQLGYQFYKKFVIYTSFRWASRSSPAVQIQTNNTSGVQLGLTYPIFSSQIKL